MTARQALARNLATLTGRIVRGEGRSAPGEDGADSADAGTAIIEFVFIAIVVMLPLVYLIAAVATVQRSVLAVREAAREAGRAYATTDPTTSATLTEQRAAARARAAVRIALANQGLADEVQLRYVPVGGGCDAGPIAPTLVPGSEFMICVRRSLDLPGVPSVLSGRAITTEGRFVVHVDDYRSA